MALSPTLIAEITRVLQEEQNLDLKVESVSHVSGGSINEAYRLSTHQGDFFLKHFHNPSHNHWFQTEAQGLQHLKKNGSLRIPEVLAVGSNFLLLEWVEEGRPNPESWEQFGRQLAQLHQVSDDRFGLDHNNFIGSLPQRNDQRSTWVEFFAELRLEPQLKMAIDSGQISTQEMPIFSRIFDRLEQWFPAEAPSLLHGDLWSGNFLINGQGHAYLIDPAIYYGHREVDIAMTQLFGGFTQEFYRGYQEEFPLESGFVERIDLANLYPLLVHVNLFGGGYVHQVIQAAKKFG
ncbi:fructosamine kinase family protein [bacterium SCSIO 12741]|nr:fructosamine kinase family protein [bacterium SCSIO 12741]